MFIPSHSMDTTFLVYDSTRDEIIVCYTGEGGVVPENAAALDDPDLLDAVVEAAEKYPKEFEELKKEIDADDLSEDEIFVKIIEQIAGSAVPAINNERSCIEDFIDGIIDIHGNILMYEIETFKPDVKTPAQLRFEQELRRYCGFVESEDDLIFFNSAECSKWNHEYEVFDEIIGEYPELLDKLITPCKPIEWQDPGIDTPPILALWKDIEKVAKLYASKINNNELFERLEKLRQKSPLYLIYSKFSIYDGYLIELLLNVAANDLPLYKIKSEDNIRKILKKYLKEKSK